MASRHLAARPEFELVRSLATWLGPQVNPDLILAAGTGSSNGFFAHDDPRGELIVGLLYVWLPMATASLLYRAGIYLWSRLRKKQPRFAPGPAAAMFGVLSYFPMTVIFLTYPPGVGRLAELRGM